jgi:hypothetical protein
MTPVRPANPANSSHLPAPSIPPELNDLIVAQLQRRALANDITLKVCEASGLDWPHASRLVAAVAAAHPYRTTAFERAIPALSLALKVLTVLAVLGFAVWVTAPRLGIDYNHLNYTAIYAQDTPIRDPLQYWHRVFTAQPGQTLNFHYTATVNSGTLEIDARKPTFPYTGDSFAERQAARRSFPIEQSGSGDFEFLIPVAGDYELRVDMEGFTGSYDIWWSLTEAPE